MSPDPMSERFAKREKQQKLDDLAKRGTSKDDLDAEEKLIKETPKVQPIQGSGQPGRNDPCPCGSGKKYKKCCGKKEK